MIQKFNEFINEKLTLNDISKMKYQAAWRDASKFKLQDLEEGDIIITNEQIFNNKYIVITRDLFNELTHARLKGGQELLFVCNDDNIHYSHLLPQYYTDNLKDMDGNTEYDIIKVYKRPKKYTDINELKQDLKNIDKF